MRIAVVFLFILLSKSISAIQPVKPISDWDYHLIRDEKQAFSYCMAQSAYANGFSLIFAENLDQTINFAIKLPSKTANIEKIQMQVKFDGGYHHLTQAYIENGDMLVLPLIQNYFLTILSNSHFVSIKGPSDIMRFELPEMEKLVRRLKSCVLIQKLPPVTATVKKSFIKNRSPILPAPFYSFFSKLSQLPADNVVDVKRNPTGDPTAYYWKKDDLDYKITTHVHVGEDYEKLLGQRLSKKTIELQDRCGPNGISFIGPLYSIGNKRLYRSMRFVCEAPKASWQQAMVFFADLEKNHYSEISYEGSSEKAKALNSLKEKTLAYLKDKI